MNFFSKSAWRKLASRVIREDVKREISRKYSHAIITLPRLDIACVWP